LAAGLCCGLGGLASGMAIGIAGDAGVRGFSQLNYQEKQPNVYGQGSGGWNKQKRQKKKNPNDLYVGMVLIQVFSGNLALFGLITAMILTSSTYSC